MCFGGSTGLTVVAVPAYTTECIAQGFCGRTCFELPFMDTDKPKFCGTFRGGGSSKRPNIDTASNTGSKPHSHTHDPIAVPTTIFTASSARGPAWGQTSRLPRGYSSRIGKGGESAESTGRSCVRPSTGSGICPESSSAGLSSSAGKPKSGPPPTYAQATNYGDGSTVGRV